MPDELPKQYDPKEAQARWLAFWDEQKLLPQRAGPDAQAVSPSSSRRRT